MADPPQRVEQVVHLVGVVEALAAAGLGADAVQPDQRVRLIDGQIDVEERDRGCCCVDRGLVAMVQADRNLRAQPVGRGTVYHVRNPPAMVASRTSLTVAGSGRAAPIALNRASGATTNASSRAMVIGRSNGDRPLDMAEFAQHGAGQPERFW